MNEIVRKISSTLILGLATMVPAGLLADDYTVNKPRWMTLSDPVTQAVYVADMKPGEIIEVSGYGHPVWIYRRTNKELEFISNNYLGATPEVVNAIVERTIDNIGSVSAYTSAQYQLVDLPELEQSPYRSKR